ncbi:hypothetical protein RM530_09095 [Algiphilus sp. W345]|uniref:Uncharacterized protein n=1 Tax=Banduia mediterranea TaxID=3075609 RepID=A0ABU2WKC1_9GAMM|nr:hypothetical protein [Algiphilus sp. W345]MDT0497517.1 hypothetical protein [Algiphilus sp. W345]
MHLHPTEGAIDDALMRIFRDDLIPTGGRLSLTTLQQEWAELPLRSDDLYQALERLTLAGRLSSECGSDGVYVTLTPDGMQRLRSVPGTPMEIWRRLRDSSNLAALDRRPRSPAGIAHNRRADDPHTPVNETP